MKRGVRSAVTRRVMFASTQPGMLALAAKTLGIATSSTDEGAEDGGGGNMLPASQRAPTKPAGIDTSNRVASGTPGNSSQDECC